MLVKQCNQTLSIRLSTQASQRLQYRQVGLAYAVLFDTLTVANPQFLGQLGSLIECLY